jgi:putative glutamine amidotransferase
MTGASTNGFRPQPLIGMPSARDKSQRYYGLPVYIQNQTYLRALAAAGAAPVTIPLQLEEETLRVIFDRLDGIFLPGGEDLDPHTYGEDQHELLGAVDSERDRTELVLARLALETGKPLLAVCRGMQLLNVVSGGSLFQDIRALRQGSEQHDYFPPQFERIRISHPVTIDPESPLGSIFGLETAVNSMHHQAVKTLGQGCRPIAWAPDGVVEGLQVVGHPFAVGVQWHPEELATQQDHQANFRLFEAFVERCRTAAHPQAPARASIPA